jgi:hypothetical protein
MKSHIPTQEGRDNLQYFYSQSLKINLAGIKLAYASQL